jgi:anti-sigma B factor antagonist
MDRGSSCVPATAAPGLQTIIVTLPCEIDVSNEAQVREALASALASKPKVVVADGTSTEFCDCAAITALVLAHRRAAEQDAQLRVVASSARVLRVMELIGAERVLHLYPSLDAAMLDGHAQP